MLIFISHPSLETAFYIDTIFFFIQRIILVIGHINVPGTKYSLFQWKLLILDVVEFLRLLFFVNGKLESVRTRWRLFSAPPKNYALHQKLYGDGIAWYNSSPRLKKGCHAWDMAVWAFGKSISWHFGHLECLPKNNVKDTTKKAKKNIQKNRRQADLRFFTWHRWQEMLVILLSCFKHY